MKDRHDAFGLVRILEHPALSRVVVKDLCKSRFKACIVRSALDRVYIVREGKKRLGVALVVLKRDLGYIIVAFGAHINDVGVYRIFVLHTV